MTMRKYSPAHDFWTPRVEGQIRDCLYAHPEWFSVKENQKRHFINSLAKRIVGEIVAVYDNGHETYEGVVKMPSSGRNGSVARMEPLGNGVAEITAPSFSCAIHDSKSPPINGLPASIESDNSTGEAHEWFTKQSVERIRNSDC